ncbi:MAG: glutamine--fructose-6-phosphate transaminase (isomerizing) [Porticoccaceae bacterium]|nr:glutamine--fructose-6-phosphate transaminase (isomerizing) [Porticoccaceae bacterium]
MCGIVAAIAQRNVVEILVEGLRRLEYRGYDSAGIAVVSETGQLNVHKTEGKVAALEQLLVQSPAQGRRGIAHTRWATHGVPSHLNAHPHVSGGVALVHNGIIENYVELRAELQDLGYQFVSDTDTEVAVHLVHHIKQQQGGSLVDVVAAAVARFRGAYALAVVSDDEPDVLVGVRHGSPLVLGVGIEENFLASDQMALRQVTDRFVFLEEDDLVELRRDGFVIRSGGAVVTRPVKRLEDSVLVADKGRFRHYMIKEIHEQPIALEATLQGRISATRVLPECLGEGATALLAKAEHVHIVACGTSYHAGLVARYWIEEWAGIPCQVEVASEYRYRKVVVPPNTLFVSISQSGETADTLAALRASAAEGSYLGSITICNVPNSSLVRESDLALMTHAGPEIGVASTKAFTTQLVALQIFAISLARYHGLPAEREQQLVEALHQLPDLSRQVLKLDPVIETTFDSFVDKQHALFLGRGEEYPIALEGALKLKEISYIHAEAYPSGELKHGPLALVDEQMPVVAVAPSNDLLEKLKSNLHEVQARGGKLYVFADAEAGFNGEDGMTLISIPHVPPSLEPIIYTLPLQLLAYHVAVMKGTDVDQPRNLAKSVTVE